MVEEKEAEEVERTTTCLAVPVAGRMGRSPYQIHLALLHTQYAYLGMYLAMMA